MSGEKYWLDDDQTISVQDVTDGQLIKMARLIRRLCAVSTEMRDLQLEITGKEPRPEDFEPPPGIGEIAAEVGRRGLTDFILD